MRFPVSRQSVGESFSASSGYPCRSRPTLRRALLVGLWSGAMLLAGCGVAVADRAGGPTTVTRDGGVADGRKLTGQLHIEADGVRVKNSAFRAGQEHDHEYVSRHYEKALPAVGAAAAAGAIGAGNAVRTENTVTRESYPGPGNTGVPAGTVLRRSGPLTLATDGAVIDGLDIVGCVLVTADNVTIRRSRISCAGRYSIRTLYAANLLVEDVEIDGRGSNDAAVCCSEYTLRRVEISNAVDGPRLGRNTVVEDSWIHRLHRRAGSHNDTLQTTGATNVTVRRNALEAYHPENEDPMNACLMIGSTTGPVVANLLFTGNYCNGGNYSIGIRTDLNASNIRIHENAFGRDHRYGVVAVPHAGVVWDSSSNVYLDSRRPVTD